jgi:hypothetical protein
VLVGVASATCQGETRVFPGDAARSLLYKKVAGKQTCGGAMPPSGPLSAVQMACLQDWITGLSGAGGGGAGGAGGGTGCETCGGPDCVDLTTDSQHCGACDKACPAGESCVAGACACKLTSCGGACTDTSADPNNCGACGNACVGDRHASAGDESMPATQTLSDALGHGSADKASPDRAPSRTRSKRLLAAALATVAATAAWTGSARAQSWQSMSGPPSIGGPAFLQASAYMADAHLLGAGLLTAIGSARTISSGELNRRWFAASLTFGVINVLSSGFTGYLAVNIPQDRQWIGFTALHGAVGLFGIVAPSIGLSLGRPAAPVALHMSPVVVGGTDAGGGRWTGAGLRLWGF